jgi:DNA (cytosine-5)-methyltransferase 1
MINVNFYLDKADKNRQYPIYLVLRQKHIQIKFTTGEKILGY